MYCIVQDQMGTCQKCKFSGPSQINGMRNFGHETQKSVFCSPPRWYMLLGSFWLTPLLNPDTTSDIQVIAIDQLGNTLLLGYYTVFYISLRACYVLWNVNKYVSSCRLWPSLGKALGNCYVILLLTHINSQQTCFTSKYLFRMHHLSWIFLGVSKSFYLSRKRQITLKKVQ